jgi:hypothetical protein
MDEAEHRDQSIELAARQPRSVTSKRRRKIREQAAEIVALREEIERLNTIIQIAVRQIIAPVSRPVMSHDGRK